MNLTDGPSFPKRPWPCARLLHVSAVADSLPRIGRELHAYACQAFGPRGEDKEVHDLRLAVQEACNNILENGGEAEFLTIVLDCAADSLIVRITSRGSPFDPSLSPARPPDPKALAEGGYGLFLIRTLTDAVYYESGSGRNVLTLVRRVGRSESEAGSGRGEDAEIA